jgi:hypothetical protein
VQAVKKGYTQFKKDLRRMKKLQGKMNSSSKQAGVDTPATTSEIAAFKERKKKTLRKEEIYRFLVSKREELENVIKHVDPLRKTCLHTLLKNKELDRRHKFIKELSSELDPKCLEALGEGAKITLKKHSQRSCGPKCIGCGNRMECIHEEPSILSTSIADSSPKKKQSNRKSERQNDTMKAGSTAKGEVPSYSSESVDCKLTLNTKRDVISQNFVIAEDGEYGNADEHSSKTADPDIKWKVSHSEYFVDVDYTTGELGKILVKSSDGTEKPLELLDPNMAKAVSSFVSELHKVRYGVCDDGKKKLVSPVPQVSSTATNTTSNANPEFRMEASLKNGKWQMVPPEKSMDLFNEVDKEGETREAADNNESKQWKVSGLVLKDDYEDEQGDNAFPNGYDDSNDYLDWVQVEDKECQTSEEFDASNYYKCQSQFPSSYLRI